MLKIDIILPYKELFSSNGASAVSISIKNSVLQSKFKKNINVYGQFVKDPYKDINFDGFPENTTSPPLTPALGPISTI